MKPKLAKNVAHFGELKAKLEPLDRAIELTRLQLKLAETRAEMLKAADQMSELTNRRVAIFDAINLKREATDRREFGAISDFQDFKVIRDNMSRRFKEFPEDLARDYLLYGTHLERGSTGITKGRKVAEDIALQECFQYMELD